MGIGINFVELPTQIRKDHMHVRQFQNLVTCLSTSYNPSNFTGLTLPLLSIKKVIKPPWPAP